MYHESRFYRDTNRASIATVVECYNTPALDGPGSVLLLFIIVKKSFAERCYALIFALLKNKTTST